MTVLCQVSYGAGQQARPGPRPSTQERSEKEGYAVPERSYDIVVVGGGNAAMCAGLMAGSVFGRIAGHSAATVSRA